MGYIVYCHINKINGKRYFGATSQKTEKRWQNGNGYYRTRFGEAIREFGWDSFEHIIVKDNLTKDEAYALEIELIAKYHTTDENFGYNVAKGGKAWVLHYGINHPNHTRVKMIDSDTGEVIRIFDSQSDAARIMQISRKGITKACQGINRTYMGYVWEYADKQCDKPNHPGEGNYDHYKLHKSIIMIEPDGTQRHFESIKKAAEDLGVRRSNISRFLTGIRQDSSGRRWCYA